MRMIMSMLFALAAFHAVSARQCLGCPKVVDTTDLYVQNAVDFAVSQLTKSSAAVDQVRTLSAAVQVVQGLNYHLHFEVQQGTSLDIFKAVVFRNVTAEAEANSEVHTLLSYDALISRKTSGAVCRGCVSDVAVDNADVVLASKFAWAEAEKMDNDVDLSAASNLQVVAAGVQTVAGKNYYLLLSGEFDNIKIHLTVTIFSGLDGSHTVIRSTVNKAIIPAPVVAAPRKCFGCPKAVDIAADDVRSAVVFAVSQIPTASAASDVKIIAAAVQVVKGLNYHLTFEVQNENSLDVFKAVVYKEAGSQDSTLLSLDALISRKTTACAGCVIDVSVRDKMVVEAATFAWTAAEKLDVDVDMTVGNNFQVLAAGYQVVNGINYHLLLVGEFNGVRVHVSSTVYRDFMGQHSMIRSSFNKALL